MKLNTIRIVSDGITSKIEVNGVDMSTATAITYRHRAGEVPELIIELPVDDAEIDSLAMAIKKNGQAKG